MSKDLYAVEEQIRRLERRVIQLERKLGAPATCPAWGAPVVGQGVRLMDCFCAPGRACDRSCGIERSELMTGMSG